MCGVFGWFQKNNEAINLKVLAEIACVTELRGAHAWGLAWVDSFGRIRHYKQRGPISESLGMLRMAADAKALIGHCRYATAGHPWFNENNHPHSCDGGWIVHNGRVGMTRSLREEYDLHPVTDCDSEYIGLLLERQQGTMVARMRETVRILSEPKMVVLGLWKKPDRLLAYRRGNPLHVSMGKSGYWLASLPEGMPGKPRMVNDRNLVEFTRKGIKHETVEPAIPDGFLF